MSKPRSQPGVIVRDSHRDYMSPSVLGLEVPAPDDIGGGLFRYRWASDEQLQTVQSQLGDRKGWVDDRLLSIPVHGLPKNVYGRGAAARARSGLPPRRNSEIGGGVLVGVVDTGWRQHWWMNGAVLAAPDDLETLDNDAEPGLERQAGHGTFVSGLILQQAQAAGVWMERALETSGDGNTSVVGEAAIRLARRGAHVINLSLGTPDERPEYQLVTESVIKAVFDVNPNVVVVAAAGNLDEGQEPEKFWPAALDGKGFENVIAVGAVDDDDKWTSWSNHGDWVDFGAPGSDLVSTYLFYEPTEQEPLALSPGYSGWAVWSGTSFAAAVVSGAIARTMTEEKVTAAQAVSFLRQTNRVTQGEHAKPIVNPKEWDGIVIAPPVKKVDAYYLDPPAS